MSIYQFSATTAGGEKQSLFNYRGNVYDRYALTTSPSKLKSDIEKLIVQAKEHGKE